MKKLDSYKDFKKGCIYNSVYVGGGSPEYAKVNGKKTFVVLEVEPELMTMDLFDRFGDPFTSEIYGDISTYGNVDTFFKDRELFEPENESEWFIKSVKVKSLAVALEEGLILPEQVQNKTINSSCFKVNSSDNNNVYYRFSIEGISQNPLLQSVFVVWDNWSTAEADFSKYGSRIVF